MLGSVIKDSQTCAPLSKLTIVLTQLFNWERLSDDFKFKWISNRIISLAMKRVEQFYYCSAAPEDVNLGALLGLFQKLSLSLPLPFSVQLQSRNLIICTEEWRGESEWCCQPQIRAGSSWMEAVAEDIHLKARAGQSFSQAWAPLQF